MIKKICDFCGKEIVGDGGYATVLLMETVYTIKMGQPLPRVREVLFCSECMGKLLKFMDELKQGWRGEIL